MSENSFPLSLPNSRAVGGMSAGSSTIRSTVLYRCAAPEQLDTQITDWLAHTQISRIFDLRSDQEVQRAPGFPEIAGQTTRTRLPLLEGALSAATTFPDLDSLYPPLLLNHPTAWVQLAEEVADNAQATLVHCTAGKDRTGMAVALLLLAVGADRDAVFEDYASSTANLEGAWLDTMRARIAAAGYPVTEKMVQLMVGTSIPGLDTALREVETRHGSVADYLIAHGLSTAKLDELATRLVD
ncbi:tyrosine-protein phosphatase [Glutamicibacter uratoxydans]|uniref:tyrosine-protein phosphatase n=1 Tax=Glutamicibacter uratoxydans TaxID=43667 RepID=UPI003D6F22FC